MAWSPTSPSQVRPSTAPSTIAREIAEAEPAAVEMTKRLWSIRRSGAAGSFHPLELAMATVAQQRSAAAARRAHFA